VLGAAFLVPLAARYRAFRGLRQAMVPIVVVTLLDMAAPLSDRGRRATRQIPPTSSIVALATLGIVNTGVAYWLFYLLINEAGAATASMITYVMPIVALFLGVGLLGERLTGAIAGLILIVLGAWLATSQRAPGDVLAGVGRRRTVAADLLQRDGDGEALSGRGRAG